MPRKEPAPNAIRIVILGFALASSVSSIVRGAGPGFAPEVDRVSPGGVQRGVASEVVIAGSKLAGHPRLVAPFPFRSEALEPSRSNASAWTFRITVAADAAMGAYPVRVQTDEGLSGPFLFVVGQLPQVMEKEDNSAFEAAQPLPATPVVVEGQVAGNDVDYFRFSGRKGQLIAVDARCARIGSGIDPVIRLTTAAASRRFVASADDTPGLLTDARLIAELPEDTDYVVELSDTRYQGAGRPVYRLTVGEVPIVEEVYPLGGRRGETIGLELRGGTLLPTGRRIAAVEVASIAGTPWCIPPLGCGPMRPAAALQPEPSYPLIASELPELREPLDPAAHRVRAAAPVVFNGRIDPAGDEDRFGLAVSPGQQLRIAVEASQIGSALDGVLTILKARDASIATSDDTTVTVAGQPEGKNQFALPDPSLDLTVPEGTSEIVLSLRDLNNRGGTGFPYRIVVTPISPTFEIQPTVDQISVPAGGTAAVEVAIVRKGYAGPIGLDIADLPAGLTVRPGTIAAGQDRGAFSISAESKREIAPVVLRLIGRRQGPDGPVEVPAARPIVFSRLGITPTCATVQHGLPAAPALPSPVTFDAPLGPIELPQGQSASISIRAVRGADAAAALSVASLPLPAGVSMAPASLPGKADQATVTLSAGIDAPIGPSSIVLEAKGTFKRGEQSMAIPAVTLNVVRPAEVSVQTPSVEIKAGGAAELRGKVQRRGTFREPITVTLSGLPAGIKAEPAGAVTVAPDAEEFRFHLAAGLNAAPASVTARVTPAYQVNKKDYPAPSSPVAIKVAAGR
ncbi:COG1470 family protein [Aquisphaera insulae]|uniref:COG1470 family protein n=1 Tax=Aquisphaera insulae TaxID=2712864 RepID=UPI0013EDE8E9|nr:hypothetical protein [Aquisphaera insulae]